MHVGTIVPRAAVDGDVVVFGMHKKEQVTKEEHDGQDYTIKELQDWRVASPHRHSPVMKCRGILVVWRGRCG